MIHHGLHHLVGLIRVQQKGAALSDGDHLPGGAAHVDIQRAEPAQLGDLLGGLAHDDRVFAEQLAGGIGLLRVYL